MSYQNKIVRSLPYPLIEEGNLSFPNGRYDIELISQGDASVTLKHNIQKAPFIQNLIKTNKATHGCLVAIPLAGYRKLHISRAATQKIEWDIDFVAEPPMFKPVIICTKEHQCTLKAKDGVAKGWQGVGIKIPKGARLALRRFFRQSGNIIGLLDIACDKEFLNGSFEVEACTEGGFYFKVKVATDLSDFLKSSHSQEHRKSIITHIISRCLEILKQEYSNEQEWQEFANLKALAQDLKDKDLAIWDEENFSADKVATVYEPHCPPVPSAQEM